MKTYKILLVSTLLFFVSTGNAFSTNYFVKSDGNDQLDGRSDATAWKTIRKINNFKFSTGDDVYFKCDDTWSNDRLIVHWSGTAENNAVIGTYYGSGIIGLNGRKPVIKGTMATTIYNNANSKWQIDNPGYPGDWIPLVHLTGQYITLDGIEITNSSGTGISVSANNYIKNCEVHETWRQALQIVSGADNVTVEDSEFHHGAKVYYLGHDDIGRPPTVTIKNCNSPIFRRCKIYNSYFENIDIGVETTGALVEFCEIYGSARLQLYLCNSTNNIIRYNLIYGTESGRGPGIWINNEEQWRTSSLNSNSKIYGNLVANTVTNIWIAGNKDRLVNNVSVYNNTFVEAVSTGFLVHSTTGDGHIFKNNIVWQVAGKLASIPYGKVDCDFNLWSSAPVKSAIGENDPPYASPSLFKKTGWGALKGGDLSGADFSLQDNSNAINTGTNLGNEYRLLSDSENSKWPLSVVIEDQAVEGIRWEIGGDIYVETKKDATPVPPSNLKIMIP